MDPRAALIAALMARQQQPSPVTPANGPPLPLARIGQLALERNLAGRGLPAAGSPSTPFSRMSAQPIPLQ